MSNKFSKKKTLTAFLFYTSILVIAIGVFFRFYNLSWGAPYFFHPDERNIASSISQLSFPQQMNPHFFAYGTLPIYCVYSVGVLTNFLQNTLLNANTEILKVNFENAIMIGRSFSFILSCLLIFLIYSIGKELSGKNGGIISASLASLSVGLIQYAHFSTFELWLTFFTTLLCYLLIKYSQLKKSLYLFYSASILGILVSIKVSSVILIPLPLITILIIEGTIFLKSKNKNFLSAEKVVLKLLLFLAISVFMFYISSPYFWDDNRAFLDSMKYETSVALGTLPVFYTQGFLEAKPILYQLVKVYPFILNPIVSFLFLLLLLPIVKRSIKKGNKLLLIVVGFFIITFFSQAFLYVKWIRYYIPTLPFIYLLFGYWVNLHISKSEMKSINKTKALLFVVLGVSFIYSFSYFKTVLYDKDTRLQATHWAQKNIPKESKIISEVYDMGIVPFNPSFSNIELFNFYDLDLDPSKNEELRILLKDSSYIILPSQRVLESRINYPGYFPLSSLFYKKMHSQKEGFKIIYKSPCDIFCKILYLGSPSFSYEQTVNVFDRPEVYIFKNDHKKTPTTQEQI